MTLNIVLVSLTTLLCLTLAAVLFNRARHQDNLPPGPTPHLLSGSTYQIPSSEPWKTYAKWSETYGSPLIHLRVSGKTTIVINSARAAIDLLEARSNIYSDRPGARPSSVPSQSIISFLLLPFTWIFSSWSPREILGDRPTVFGASVTHPRFKKYRKLLQTSLNPRAVKKYRNLMEQERLILLKSLLHDPAGFFQHVRRNAGAVILSVAYGWKVTSNDDSFVHLMEDAFSIQNLIRKPSGWLVEFLPFLRFLPSWFPGNGYKRRAAYLKERMWHFDNVPHRWAKEQIDSGNFIESFTSQHLRPEDGHTVDAEEEDIIKWTSSALYFGGADTTIGSVLSFILFMTLYPDAQKRAQDEIDRVVGKGRLPTTDDQDELVYVNALIKEVLRLAPVAPLGLPHRAMEEDVYMGYRIPQDATLIANIWAIARDEETFNRPYDFDPSRFLSSDDQGKVEMDPRKLVFGYGRRACPGSHFAEISVYLSITGILATFNIRKHVQEDGSELTPKFEFTTGITSHPKPFMCRIEPRRPDLSSHI